MFILCKTFLSQISFILWHKYIHKCSAMKYNIMLLNTIFFRIMHETFGIVFYFMFGQNVVFIFHLLIMDHFIVYFQKKKFYVFIFEMMSDLKIWQIFFKDDQLQLRKLRFVFILFFIESMSIIYFTFLFLMMFHSVKPCFASSIIVIINSILVYCITN